LTKHILSNFCTHRYTDQSNWQGCNESVNLYNIWASIKDDCTSLPVETRAPVTAEDEIEFAERVVPGSPVSSTTRSWIHVSPNNLGPNRTPKRHTSENVNLYTYEIKKNKVLKYELHLKSFYHFPKLLKKHQKKGPFSLQLSLAENIEIFMKQRSKRS
jgi:hypothetical protein